MWVGSRCADAARLLLQAAEKLTGPQLDKCEPVGLKPALRFSFASCFCLTPNMKGTMLALALEDQSGHFHGSSQQARGSTHGFADFIASCVLGDTRDELALEASVNSYRICMSILNICMAGQDLGPESQDGCGGAEEGG